MDRVMESYGNDTPLLHCNKELSSTYVEGNLKDSMSKHYIYKYIPKRSYILEYSNFKGSLVILQNSDSFKITNYLVILVI
jgi:hypothetical protein